ncbi:MAG: glycoside hydrolase family 5 protein [Lachnospiraceae bacterium]
MRKFEGFQKGVNLGGWISQFAKYDPKHFETFITKKDIDYIAGLGFDHVRVPVDYNVLEDEDGNMIESGFAYLKNCMDWCRANNLRMLIDLHECFGYSFDPLKKDMDRKVFFYDEKLQERFLKLWTEIATRFRDYQEMVAFEPLNEVVLPEVADAWNKLVRRYIEMMREIVPDAYLVIGGVCYNDVLSVPLLDAPYDNKIVYNFHCYDPKVFTHQGAYWMEEMPSDFRIGYPETVENYRRASRAISDNLEAALFNEDVTQMGVDFFEKIFAPALEHAKKNDAPLYCGEYGVIDLANNEDKIRWLKDIHTAFAKHGIGHALWNYKEKDFGFVDPKFEEIKDEFIACL